MCSIEQEIPTKGNFKSKTPPAGDCDLPYLEPTGSEILVKARGRHVVAGLCHKCKESPPVVDMKRVMYCKYDFRPLNWSGRENPVALLLSSAYEFLIISQSMLYR